MKVRDITTAVIADYLRIPDPDENDLKELETYKSAALAFVSSYTGISLPRLNEFEDISIAVLVLCQDMYDSRSYYVDKTNVNKVVSTILDMHSRNLIC